MHCDNCGNVRSFASDYRSGDRYCTVCGLVLGRVMVVSNGYKSVFDSHGNIRVGARGADMFTRGQVLLDSGAHHVRRSKSAPYKRATYFAERITQWCQREPRIDWKVRLTIDRAYRAGRYAARYVLTKRDVRAIVRDAAAQTQTPRFVDKYLEKWLTIRYILTGEPSYGYYFGDVIAPYLKEMFAKLQQPFEQTVRTRRKRYSFISYNFVFRRLFDLLGFPEFGEDFPPLCGAAKRVELVALWLRMMNFLNWPYINSDRENFGIEYYVDPFLALQKHDAAHQPQRDRAGSDGARRVTPQRRAASDDDWSDLTDLVDSWT
ncbi:MAG: hypothetical protein ACPGR8_06385 [Limisphaerales bacterium]